MLIKPHSRFMFAVKHVVENMPKRHPVSRSTNSKVKEEPQQPPPKPFVRPIQKPTEIPDEPITKTQYNINVQLRTGNFDPSFLVKIAKLFKVENTPKSQANSFLKALEQSNIKSDFQTLSLADLCHLLTVPFEFNQQLDILHVINRKLLSPLTADDAPETIIKLLLFCKEKVSS